jgi:hypothetical protein
MLRQDALPRTIREVGIVEFSVARKPNPPILVE